MPDIDFYPSRTTTAPTDRVFIASSSSDQIDSATLSTILGGNPVNGYFYRNNLLSRPAGSSLTWLNQDSASYTDVTNGPLILVAPTGGSTEWNLLTTPMPSGSFTTTWCITPQYTFTNSISTGICVLNSSNNMYPFCIANNNGYYTLLIERWGSPTSYNSGVVNVEVTPGQIFCFQIVYDSSTNNISFNFSVNGEYFSNVTTLSTSDFLGSAPTKIGFGVKPQGGSYVNKTVGMLYYQYTTQP